MDLIMLIGLGYGLSEALLGKMGIALGGGDIGVAKHLLHVIKGHTAINERGGKGMAQIVDPDIFKPNPFAGIVPGVINACVGLHGLRIGENPA